MVGFQDYHADKSLCIILGAGEQRYPGWIVTHVAWRDDKPVQQLRAITVRPPQARPVERDCVRCATVIERHSCACNLRAVRVEQRDLGQRGVALGGDMHRQCGAVEIGRDGDGGSEFQRALRCRLQAESRATARRPAASAPSPSRSDTAPCTYMRLKSPFHSRCTPPSCSRCLARCNADSNEMCSSFSPARSSPATEMR